MRAYLFLLLGALAAVAIAVALLGGYRLAQARLEHLAPVAVPQAHPAGGWQPFPTAPTVVSIPIGTFQPFPTPDLDFPTPPTNHPIVSTPAIIHPQGP
jgi:hypothetical protein